MRTVGYAFAILLMMCAQGQALTLDEAVSRALKDNPTLKQLESAHGAALEGAQMANTRKRPRIELSYSYSRYDEAPNMFVMEEASVLTLQASYNLFNGFADKPAIAEATTRAEAVAFKRTAAEGDIALGVKAAYAEVLLAAKSVETAREAVELLERHRKNTVLFLKEGLIARNELLKVEVELASVRQDLLGAEGNHRIARKRLESLIGPLSPEEALEDVAADEAMAWPQMDELKARMFDNRSELKALAKSKESMQMSAQVIDAGKWPRVDVAAAHERYGDDLYPSGVADDNRLMLMAQWSLYDGQFRKHDLARSQKELEALDHEVEGVRRDMVLQLQEALEGHELALGKLSVAKAAVGQAQENYRVTDAQFRERVATSTDLMDARTLLSRARTQHNAALYGLFVAKARIERVTGK